MIALFCLVISSLCLGFTVGISLERKKFTALACGFIAWLSCFLILSAVSIIGVING